MGRGVRHHLLRDRDQDRWPPDPPLRGRRPEMSTARRVLGVAAGAVGVAAAGTALRVAQRRRVIARRGVGDQTPFGSLRSEPLTVVADDGLPLYVEIDELDPELVGGNRLGKRSGARRRHAELTV